MCACLCSYTLSVGTVVCLVPADLMGFFGAIGFAPTTFWLPSLIWIVVKKPKRNTFSFWFNSFNIVLCVTVMFLAAIGSMYWIVRNASGYKFYQ